MTRRLRVGTRASPLAVRQTESVVRALRSEMPDTLFELTPLKTQGDRRKTATQDLDFTDRIDRELESGGVDLAVHSAKDLPGQLQRAVTIAALPRRGDPRDCVVLANVDSFRSLPSGARIGSSSVRRKAQLLRWRPDVKVVPVRGNVGTRLERMELEGFDGVVLAAAGLKRLGLANRISAYLPITRVLPAPGQGALAVMVRASDQALARRVGEIDDPATRAAILAERGVQGSFGGNCDLPLGAYASVRGNELALRAVVLTPRGVQRDFRTVLGRCEDGPELGARLGASLAKSHAAWVREGLDS